MTRARRKARESKPVCAHKLLDDHDCAPIYNRMSFRQIVKSPCMLVKWSPCGISLSAPLALLALAAPPALLATEPPALLRYLPRCGRCSACFKEASCFIALLAKGATVAPPDFLASSCVPCFTCYWTCFTRCTDKVDAVPPPALLVNVLRNCGGGWR